MAGDYEKVFMAKCDIKDVFWQLDWAKGKEWNFVYILTMHGSLRIKLMVSKSLQMGN